jgi:hypothetical protein
MTTLSEYRLRQEIIRVIRIVANQGLIRSSDGTISVRLDDDRFLVTPRGLYKMSMNPDDPDCDGFHRASDRRKTWVETHIGHFVATTNPTSRIFLGYICYSMDTGTGIVV